jgi:hypothetical protein
MPTRDRVIQIRLIDDFAGRRFNSRSSRVRAREARHRMRTEAMARLAECNSLTDAAPSEAVHQPSYACRLYTATAT